MNVAFAGVFAAHVADRVRARLRIPCEVAVADDREVTARLGGVVAVRRDPTRPDPHRLTSVRGPEALEDTLRRADYLAITVALTPQTRGLIGARELGLMRPTAILINVARAEVVDEDALYEALYRGALAGAALDVWYRYPAGGEPTPPGHRPFHTLPNVLMTPHVSGWTEGMMDARAAVIAENIHRVARGEAPVNQVK